MAGTSGEASIDIQDRDLALLQGLFESRLMTLAHIADIHFEGRAEAAKKRVQKLKKAGLLRERPRRPYEPAIHHLSLGGYRLLRAQGALDGYPSLSEAQFERKRADVSALTILHELRVMDVKAAFVAALRTSTAFSLAEFTTMPALCQFEAFRPDGRKMILRPDGFVRVTEITPEQEYEHGFFLEVDRSTEVLDTLAVKAACYVDYYLRGGFARRCGLDPSQYKQAPFRVLLCFKSAERRDNVAQRLLAADLPLRNLTWLTTLDEIVEAPLGAIWTRLADHLESVSPPHGSLLLRGGSRDGLFKKHALFGAA